MIVAAWAAGTVALDVWLLRTGRRPISAYLRHPAVGAVLVYHLLDRPHAD